MDDLGYWSDGRGESSRHRNERLDELVGRASEAQVIAYRLRAIFDANLLMLGYRAEREEKSSADAS